MDIIGIVGYDDLVPMTPIMLQTSVYEAKFLSRAVIARPVRYCAHGPGDPVRRGLSAQALLPLE